MFNAFLNSSKRFALLQIFLFTHFLFLFAASFETSIIEENLTKFSGVAVFFHFVSIVFFVFGYRLYSLLRASTSLNSQSELKDYFEFSKMKARGLYVICVFGVFVSLFQVGQFVSLENYFADLISFSNPGDVRGSFLATQEEGGLQGILKMWAYGPLAVFLFSTSVVTFLNLSRPAKAKMQNIMVFSLICTLFKVFLALDRLSMLAIILAAVMNSLHKNTLFRFRNVVAAAIAFVFITFISYNRLSDVGVWDFLVLYCRLGLMNVGILYDTLQSYSLGFFTIFSPIRPVLKFFLGKEFGLESLNYESGWHPAQYLLGYSFLDFGYLFFIFYVILGYIAAKFDYECVVRRIPMLISIYFSLIYCYASFIFVPAFTGIEFWLTIVIGLYASGGLIRISFREKL